MHPEVFYLHIQGEQRGPYTVPQIDHLLNSGLIQAETLFWREGLEQWLPVTNLVALRKPARRWIKPAIAAGLLLILVLVLRLFGPIIHEGWREANQHEFTASGAYWRARDAVRHAAVPSGTLVEFSPIAAARTQLQPPDAAEVLLRGILTDGHGAAHGAAWAVQMHYDARLKEWSSLSVKEAPFPP